MVWVIRNYRPDVIVARLRGTPRDGHGHHQTSAMLGKEAFDAAADPNDSPSSCNTSSHGARSASSAAAASAAVDAAPAGPAADAAAADAAAQPRQPAPKPSGEAETGAFNPVLGYSYDELAVLSRSMHHSQGTGAMLARRRRHAVRAGRRRACPKDLFDGIDTTWNRVPGSGAVAPILAEAVRA